MEPVSVTTSIISNVVQFGAQQFVREVSEFALEQAAISTVTAAAGLARPISRPAPGPDQYRPQVEFTDSAVGDTAPRPVSDVRRGSVPDPIRPVPQQDQIQFSVNRPHAGPQFTEEAKIPQAAERSPMTLDEPKPFYADRRKPYDALDTDFPVPYYKWVQPMSFLAIFKTRASGIPARSGATPGASPCDSYYWDSDNTIAAATSDTGVIVEDIVYNLSATAVGGSRFIGAMYDRQGRAWVVLEDCP
jgi:hypothetical protein